MKAQFACYTLCLVLLLSSEVLSLTPEQIAHEKMLTELAKERCDTEQVEGSNYSVKLIGDGKVEVSFFGKKGGALKGTFIYTKSEWEGRQRVLMEHQASENKDRRKCIKEELNSLRESYEQPKDEAPPDQKHPQSSSNLMDSTLWAIDNAGVCRDDDGKYPRWSDYRWTLERCEAACISNPNCQGFSMSKTENYCQLIGSDGSRPASKPGTRITRGNSSQPMHTCYLKR